MRKSEVVMDKLNRAQMLLERVATLVDQVIEMDESGDGTSAGAFMTTFDKMVDLIENLSYEIAMPLQMEEDARDEEIERLEARLAELRQQ